MEWKSARTAQPEPGKIYIVVDSKGRYWIRKYDEVYVSADGKRYTTNEHVKNSRFDYSNHKKINMFIPEGSKSGPVPKTSNKMILFYIELPDLPGEFKEAAEIREQIRTLEKRLERMGRI